ncbi:unnamed protein product [Ostreobium quekettii]|uniref:Superoxide dismutase [Cu-Zn] n=1 Tax=Ostreobium quekettii TaxID=121088 RepID=A0A8S1IZE2_9CHLO|nr:unnamed protein product [Ostreobium quekettii]
MKPSVRCLAPLLALLLAVPAPGFESGELLKATCVLANGPAEGLIIFTEKVGKGKTLIHGNVRGLGPHSKHGFHVHSQPITNGNCSSAGGHYNPFNATHGGRLSEERHVGDLGNIHSDAYGISQFKFIDRIVSLSDPETSVVNHSVVVHAAEDDHGLGGDAGSLATGNAGARIGCCVIEQQQKL